MKNHGHAQSRGKRVYYMNENPYKIQVFEVCGVLGHVGSLTGIVSSRSLAKLEGSRCTLDISTG